MKRRISFPPDVSKGQLNLICTGPVQSCSAFAVVNVFFIYYCSQSAARWEHLLSGEQSAECYSTNSVNCHSTGENADEDVGRERESNSCLKSCSGVLGPSSPNPPVLNSDLIVREKTDRNASFEGILSYFINSHSLSFPFFFVWSILVQRTCASCSTT